MNEIIHLSWKDASHQACWVAHKIRHFMSKNLPGQKEVRLYGIPRGGVLAALLVQQELITKFQYQAVMRTDIADADVIIDDIIDTGRTRQRIQDMGYRDTFYVALIDKTIKKKAPDDNWYQFPWEVTADGKIQGPEDNIVRLLEYIGEDPLREGLAETPTRVVRSFEKLYGGYRQEPASILKTFEDGACDEMVILKNVEFYSTCEHHMLPFCGKAHIAYIPNGKVIGVSKLARLLEIYARRLQIQERICQQVTDALEQHLEPKGAACILEAQHFCMTSRGVEKQNSVMTTSSLVGEFKNAEARGELLDMIKG